MSTALAFAPGDVVRLKSGGPRMTVIRSTSTDEMECVWFPGDDGAGFAIASGVRVHAFPPAALERVAENRVVEALVEMWRQVGQVVDMGGIPEDLRRAFFEAQAALVECGRFKTTRMQP